MPVVQYDAAYFPQFNQLERPDPLEDSKGEEAKNALRKNWHKIMNILRHLTPQAL